MMVYFGLPFQIGVAESGFAKPFVKIFKVGSHPLVDDYPQLVEKVCPKADFFTFKRYNETG